MVKSENPLDPKDKNRGLGRIHPDNFKAPIAPAADTPDWIHKISEAEKAELNKAVAIEKTFQSLQESLLGKNLRTSKKYEPSSSKQE